MNGDWFAIVTYADATAYEKAQALFPQDPELQRVFIEIAKFDKRDQLRNGDRSRSLKTVGFGALTSAFGLL